MASDTKIDLRKQMIYSIFVRNYSPEGNFEGVQKDLDRIKDLGTDIIWLLPIQPSGKEKRKGAWVPTLRNFRLPGYQPGIRDYGGLQAPVR